jgi:hypothetical protein
MPTETNSTVRRFGLGWVVVGLLLSLVRCTTARDAPYVEPPSSGLIHAEPWPEADALFRSDPRWLGSDDAYSVDLGGGRVLWLFADTFISTARPGWPRLLPARRTAVMVRNSVGIQSGYDPSTASIAFYWRTEEEKPGSFFPEEGETWFWPGHGLVVEDALLVFLMATRASAEGLGFEHTGWRAVRVANYEQPPSEWRLDWLEAPESPFGLIVSGSVLRLEEHIYGFSVREPEHTIHLARWPAARARAGDLSQPQWWDGEDAGWVAERDLAEAPQALFSEGHTEFTVHYEPALGRFLEVQTVGFGPADLGFRLADTTIGEWTPLERFYRPQEYEMDRILIYAAKAHPELTGAELVLTYATNTYPYARLVRREDLYYPRFLKARFEMER